MVGPKTLSFNKNGDRWFDFVNHTIMMFVIILCLYPLWYVFVLSLSDHNLVSSREVWLWPKFFTWSNYEAVFSNNMLINSYIVSIKRTIIGTFLSVFLCGQMAYALSKKHLIGRKFIIFFVLITFYIGGGLIPSYLLWNTLGLTNNFWGLIVPTLFSGWNIIIMKTFYQGLPISLDESAKIDGASDSVIFFRIVLPLSMPLMATMGLFTAVYHWNDWFMGNLLMSNDKNIPLATLLMKIIFQNEARLLSMGAQQSIGILRPPSPESIKMAAIVISTVPILLVYPFLQKYFVKGVLVGSIKE